jgi:hypothetical protein
MREVHLKYLEMGVGNRNGAEALPVALISMFVVCALLSKFLLMKWHIHML